VAEHSPRTLGSNATPLYLRLGELGGLSHARNGTGLGGGPWAQLLKATPLGLVDLFLGADFRAPVPATSSSAKLTPGARWANIPLVRSIATRRRSTAGFSAFVA
jgi:hypothetical protein